MRILSRRDVLELLTLRDCIAAVEDAFRLRAEGRTLGPGVLGVPAAGGGFHIKAAGLVGERSYFAAKTVAISWLYVRFGGLSRMQAAFYGVGAAVIGIITIAAYTLAKLTMAKDRVQWVIFAVLAVVTAWTESEIVWLFLLSGVVALVVQTPPAWLKRSAPACFAVAATPELLAQIVWFLASSRDDFDNMARQFPMYDAFYAYCRTQAPAPPRPRVLFVCRHGAAHAESGPGHPRLVAAVQHLPDGRAHATGLHHGGRHS